MKKFLFYKQLDSMDCGPDCLRVISQYYGKSYGVPFLREKCYIDKAGVSVRGINEVAELIEDYKLIESFDKFFFECFVSSNQFSRI